MCVKLNCKSDLCHLADLEHKVAVTADLTDDGLVTEHDCGSARVATVIYMENSPDIHKAERKVSKSIEHPRVVKAYNINQIRIRTVLNEYTPCRYKQRRRVTQRWTAYR